MSTQSGTKWNPFDHHKGPYQLAVLRTKTTGKVKWSFEALRGHLKRGADVLEEAEALLTDPRDSIETVFVYSVKHKYIVTAITKAAVTRKAVK